MQLALCHCSRPQRRTHSGVEEVPQISSLAGATLQRGRHSTGGSVQTLKWADYDADRRRAYMHVFGGFGGEPHVGHWTEPADNFAWLGLMCLARVCTYGYTFQFAEDFSRADIFITGNCCCCLLLPCVPLWCSPGWFTIPSSLVAFEMVQAEGSSDGSFWRRNSSTCGQPFKHTYDLVEVFRPTARRASTMPTWPSTRRISWSSAAEGQPRE